MSNILVNYLKDINFITKISGVVYPVKLKSGDNDKTVPVADLVLENCQDSTNKIMVPDKNQTCIVYFEDKGVQAKNNDSRYVNFESTLQLVGWCNLEKIGLNDTSLLVANIIKKIPFQIPNQSPLVKISASFNGEEPKSSSIFSKYDYNEKVNYLSKPYDYFALNYRVKFSIPISCIDDIILNANQC